jgi:two-component system, NtrC family, sensor kinase
MIYSVLFAALALLCLFRLSGGPMPDDLMSSGYWLGLWFAVLALIIQLALEHLQLMRLRQGLLKAREGLLGPVSTRGLSGLSAAQVTEEYNITIQALESMFRTVEECQGRFLNQRNKMNTMLQSLPGALLSLSDDLQIILANEQAKDFFDNQKLVGTNLFDLLHLGERDREVLRDAFLYKQPIQSQEITLSGDSGPRYYSLNLGFYSDAENDLGGVLFLQDISEYRRLQDSVALREKLVAMGQLAAGVAHELNTPLGNIHGYAQLLGRTPEAPAKLAEYAGIISDEAKRCSRIVQDLLNFAREDRCSGETCEINQLVRDLIETFLNCRMRRYKIVTQLDLHAKSLVVEGGCGQLDIVLTNLIINAIHALDGIDNPSIVISTRIEDSYAVIGVADNGPGVPADLRSRIFDPFFSTKEVGQGSGLGLPISHAIMAKRGGFIVYDDEYTAGARFLVKLPMVDLRRAGM